MECISLHVHGTSCLCTLSASAFMHWDIPTWGRFLNRNLFMDTCFCLLAILLRGVTQHVSAVDASSAHVCAHVHWWMASNSQYAMPPQSSPQKKSQVVSPGYVQSKAQINHPQIISWLLVGCFERYTSGVAIVASPGPHIDQSKHVVTIITIAVATTLYTVLRIIK